jgi:hypothetical protein
MESFIEHAKSWNKLDLKQTNDLYQMLINDFKIKGIEKHLVYHFLFSNPNIISKDARHYMIQWMETQRTILYQPVNQKLVISEHSLNHLVLQLNQLASQMILFYEFSLHVLYPAYTSFLWIEIQKLYSRIEKAEHLLYTKFLYPRGEPEWVTNS